MLEGTLDLLIIILDLFLLGSSSKEKRYFKIDRIVQDWAKKVGINTQYEYKDEKVRSLNVMDDAGNKYQICVETIKWRRIKVCTTNNISGPKRKIWTKKCKLSNLTKVLFEAYGVTEQWISKSGNSRTIN
ncbi:hypothetical protein ACFO5T_12675 [Dokdonia genika]|uniref:Uncharacterized protein n=1 Tax=Dokdonia genika TaxID=308113 RepID=A0ABV9LBZ1_9FLAO